MKKTWNAAIIGCGSIHEVHAGVLKSLEGVRLTAVCDDKPDRAERSAAANGCRAYTDYRELLNDPEVDAVHICTPHWLHSPMTVDALRAGKFVLVEKPMAISVAEAQAMVAEDARQGGTRLCVVFQNRYNESTRMLKCVIDGGTFGALRCLRGSVVWQRTEGYYSDDWHGKRALEGGGVMINQAIHTLDAVQWLGGGAASIKGSVSTDGLAGVIEVEDTAHMRIRMKNGVTAVLYATVAYGDNAPIEIEAMLEGGTFLLRGDRLYRTDDGFELLCNPDGKPIGARDYWGSGHIAQISDFYRCIDGGLPFFIDGAAGIEAVKLFCGLYESSVSGREVGIV